MKTCGCPSDTLGSLLVTPLARGEAGLAEPSPRVNRPPYALSCLRRIAFGSTRPIVAALHSPSSDGRSSERGDAVNRGSLRTPVYRRAMDRVYKVDSTELQSARRRGAP